MGQQHAIHKFVLGTKDFDDKQSEFMYDKGWYSITDIVGEEIQMVTTDVVLHGQRTSLDRKL